MAARMSAACAACESGALVLLGDPGRAYLPAKDLSNADAIWCRPAANSKTATAAKPWSGGINGLYRREMNASEWHGTAALTGALARHLQPMGLLSR